VKVLKVLGGLLVLAIVLFLFVANFSAVESRYECVGTLSSSNAEQPSTIFLKLETYRPWVGRVERFKWFGLGGSYLVNGSATSDTSQRQAISFNFGVRQTNSVAISRPSAKLLG
jgi:hypothetical protein